MIKKSIYCVFLAFAVISSTPAQQLHNTSSSGDKYFEIAEELYANSEYDSSSYYYDLAAQGYKLEERWNEYVTSRIYSGTNYRYMANYDKALMLLNDALNTSIEKFGNKDSILSDVYNSLGSFYYEKMDYENALDYYSKSLQISLDTWGENKKETGRGYHNTGLIYYRAGDAEQALQYFNKALAIWLPITGEKHSNIGNCYINIANSYYLMEDFEKGISYDLKALDVWKSVLGEKHPYIALSYMNIAITNETLKNYPAALEYHNKALLLRQEIFGESHHETASSYASIANVYSKSGEYNKSENYYKKAFSILDSMYSHPYRYEAIIQYAGLQTKTGNFDKAIAHYDTALAYFFPGLFTDSTISKAKAAPVKVENWNAISGKGDAFYFKYLHASENPDDLIKALEWYKNYSDYLENVRSSYRREKSKILIGSNLFDINSKIINTALMLYDLKKDDEYKHQAFLYSEMSKAAVLSDAITESGAKKFGNIPDSLLLKEKALQNDINSLELRVYEAEEEDNPLLLPMKDKLFDLVKEYDQVIKYFELNFPGYFKLKHDNALTGIDDIRKAISGEDEILIEYFIADTITYLFALDKHKLEIKIIDTKELTGLVKTFRSSLNNIDYSAYLNSAFVLYTLLLEPAKEMLAEKKKIWIIPDGILNYLPFEALLTKNIPESSADFSKLPYLLNDFEISYHFSAHLLSAGGEGRVTGSNFSFAGFAPVFPDELNKDKINKFINPKIVTAGLRSVIKGDKTYSSLPESETEVNEIMNLFKTTGFTGKAYTFSEATEKTIKSEEIKNYECIHLATHGFINEDQPKLSGLIFSDEENDMENGILYSGEIFNLSLNTDLVVLSACESGLGKVVRGEGILGLTRGFAYSGAKNIVVSLWQVADKSTSELMIEFYKNILAGKKYSAALREAKLKLINDGDYSYPLEWAPFVLIGK